MRLKILLVVGIFGYSLGSFAQSFQACTGTDSQRNLLDTFCPRIEGAHPDGCCPPIFNNTQPIQCDYYRGSSHVGQAPGTYATCQNGVTVNIPCCASISMVCGNDIIQKTFIPRLIQRNNSCCFESCPSAEYWMSPPNPDTRFKQDHLIGSVSACGSPPNTCPAGLPACLPSQPCAPPNPTGNPNLPTPTGGPTILPPPPGPTNPPVNPPPPPGG